MLHTAENTIRKTRTRDFKKSAILSAARQVMESEGKHELTIRSVAKAAGYTPGAVYAYFSGKDELLLELLAQDLAALAKSLKTNDMPLADMMDLAIGTLKQDASQAPLRRFLDSANTSDCETGKLVTGRLLQVLTCFSNALSKTGRPLSDNEKKNETLLIAALVTGIALFERSGRLKLFDATAQDLTTHYLARLAES